MSSYKQGSFFIYLFLTGLIFVWGLNFSLVKWAVSEMSPLAFNVVRYSLASFLILSVLLIKEGWQYIPAKDALKIFALGVWGHSIYQVLFIKGISLTTAGNSSLFLATIPLWTAVLSAILGKDKLNRKAWIGILLAFIGVFVITIGSGQKISLVESNTTGNLLTLLAALSFAGYTVLSKDLLKRYSPLRLTALTMVIGSIGLWIFANQAVIQQHWTGISWKALGVILYSAVLAIVVGYLIWFTGIKRVGPTRTAIFSNLTPIIAVGIAFLLLSEPLVWLQGLGGAAVLGGISLTIRN